MTTEPRQPALNDPVVIAGTKYRMKSIGAGGWILVRDRWTKEERSVRADSLTWDARAGVWRVPA